MKIFNVSAYRYNQNFSGVSKFVEKLARGAESSTFITSKGNVVGEHVVLKNGALKGWRKFKGGETIDYATVNVDGKTAGNAKSVSYVYRFPNGKGAFLRRWFVFDLDKFNANIKELTSLKGIKGYLAKIESAPKVTKYEPCS